MPVELIRSSARQVRHVRVRCDRAECSVVNLEETGIVVQSKTNRTSKYAHKHRRIAIHLLDLPFMALYLLDEDGGQARLRAVTRALPEEWFPVTLPLTLDRSPWQLDQLRAEGQRQHILGLVGMGLNVSAGPWSDPVQQAVLCR